MATVYLADDIKNERKVALKVLKPELAAVVGAERFPAEIKTTANLIYFEGSSVEELEASMAWARVSIATSLGRSRRRQPTGRNLESQAVAPQKDHRLAADRSLRLGVR